MGFYSTEQTNSFPEVRKGINLHARRKLPRLKPSGVGGQAGLVRHLIQERGLVGQEVAATG